MVSYEQFSALYKNLVDQRDYLEQPRVLTGLINNNILQNKLITELQSNRGVSSTPTNPKSDVIIKELSDKI